VHIQKHVRDIREADVLTVKALFPPAGRVLELGGGNGFQASIIASWGYDCTSVDVEAWPSGEPVFFPVQLYDGKRLPFSAEAFDVVYSSHVLEHVPDPVALLNETRRVLKPDGIAIHILPSVVWRGWTIAAHYPYLLKRVAQVIRSNGKAAAPTRSASRPPRRSLGERLRRVLIAKAHGEYPTAISELYFFSRRRWTKVFEQSGFTVQQAFGDKNFFTGYRLFPFLTVRPRRAVAKLLGSSANVFALRKR
jgi:SAM-dependent methyltransferase